MSNSKKNSNNIGSKNASRAKREKSRKIGIILANIQLVITLIFVGLLLMLNVLPAKYLTVIIVVLVFFVIYAFLSQLTKNFRTAGKIISVFMSLLLVFGSYYLIETGSMLSEISGKEVKVDEMQLIVLKDDPAETINDTVDYFYGINEIIDREKTNEVIEKINDELDKQINTSVYSGYDSLVDSLYDGDSQVIIINEAYRKTIQETARPDFDEETRVLGNFEVESEIVTNRNSDIDLTKEPFHVFISGIDTSGSISKTGRSDVNIIATINPNSQDVLLTTTPRDYYIPFPNTKGQEDKLTHAGIYGVDISMGALEDLYDIEMEYYVRVNFDTLINLVDTLGGVKVNSDYSFSAGGYKFNKGINEMDGKQALAFSRERSSFSAGDMQRGRNQMEVIKGIINKALSPAIIVNYSRVMDSIAGSFETNLTEWEITELIKMQIGEMSPWNIESNSVIGKPSREVTYTQGKGRKYAVVLVDDESVNEAKTKMYEVMGTALTSED